MECGLDQHPLVRDGLEKQLAGYLRRKRGRRTYAEFARKLGLPQLTATFNHTAARPIAGPMPCSGLGENSAEFPLAKTGRVGTLYSRLSDSLAFPRHGKSSGELASVMI